MAVVAENTAAFTNTSMHAVQCISMRWRNALNSGMSERRGGLI